MRNLTCGQQYFYRLGSPSDNLWTDEPPQIGFYALCDQGAVESTSTSVALHLEVCWILRSQHGGVSLGFGGRAPIWAAYGDLGLDVDQYRDVAPSIPALAAELQVSTTRSLLFPYLDAKSRSIL